VALDLLERHSLSPMELRILVAVRDRDRPESELATRFGGHRMSLRPSAGALYARGFLRWRYVAGDDDSWFSLTPAGRLLLRPLLSAITDGDARAVAE
jgi:DNA-binding MarR family transcriptional regulator